ncbi:hypothetical protein BDQ94DRAFT_180859 [Aspergillus welwitschiae]|uniref:C2H2-type domain-containing protein n=1 Tax=Aspergillus welwitschiae TaxID=1341132 RepID=A0A3F3PV97_9EURO|nr:hypothetical protein BDQ94DRAFT_180859 [Aspergillus welwitschiae]RDH30829.1 hypothetical protein BDQ94DRAFT_180859 [Aspergillus welwitschiae]
MAVPTEPTELLHYIPQHRVLICKKCKYAIQPSAIPRHLKEMHKIYRSHRQRYIDYTDQLDLAKPDHVVLPEANEGPIPFLPIIDGLACGASGCHHLCATGKRMKMHCNAEHPGVPVVDLKGNPVRMQTFFRGNQLRYFVVHQPQTNSHPEQHAAVENKEPTPVTSPTCDLQELAAEDVRLLEHFQTSLSRELAFDAIMTPCWDTAESGVLARYSFLKHGILSCSALHLAFLNPSKRQRYRLMAAHHQNIALPDFRSAVKQPTVDNCVSLLAFTQLLIVHCFGASQDEDGDDDDDLLLAHGHNDPFPDWLQVLRSTCHIFKPIEGYIRTLPIAMIMAEDDHQSKISAKSYCDPRLDKLFNLVNPDASKQASEPFEVHHSPLLSALTLLSSAFSRAHEAQARNNYSLCVALHVWPVRVPDAYLGLVKQRHPVALVLLAHYCILLLPLEGSWYMNGYSKRLITRISEQLGKQWRPWLQWPLEEVGL